MKIIFNIYKTVATAEKAIYKNKLYFKYRRQNIDLDAVPVNNPDPDPAIRENIE